MTTDSDVAGQIGAPYGYDGIGLGRIVHVWINGTNVASIVTDVGKGGAIDATLFPPRGMPYTQIGLPFDAFGERSPSWHWPPRA